MAMYYINVFERGSPLQVNVKRLENLLEAVVMGIQSQLAGETQSADVILVFVLHAKATSFDVAELGKFLTEELDVNTCTTINFWWEFIGKNSSVHNTVNSG